MPYNGTGGYTLPTVYKAFPDTTILNVQHNTPLEDIQQALSQVLLKDGRAPMTGPLRLFRKSELTDEPIRRDETSDAGRAIMIAADKAAQRTFMEVPSVAEMNAADAATAALETRSRRRLDRADATDIMVAPESVRWAFYESGSLFPGILPWQDNTNATAVLTNQFIDETIDEHARYGIDRLLWIKAEQFGYAMFPFTFTPWTDDQAGRALQSWQNASPAGWIPTNNAILRALDRADANGFKIVIGLGNCGDDWLSVDVVLPGTTVSALTSAALAAIPKATRVATAIARQCQMAQDLFNQFGSHPGFAGFYITHEPDNVTACTALMKGTIVDGGGGFPGVGTHRLPNGSPVEVWVSPADVDDFPAANASAATWEAWVAQLRSWGATHIVPQDAVGSGEDINGVPTWNPANRLAMMRDYAAQWARAAEILNCPGLSDGQAVLMGINLEMFQMDGPGYTNPYPAAGTRLIEQIAKTADRLRYVGFYGIFPYAMRSSLSRRLPQSYSGKTDFRTRADALDAFATTFIVAERRRRAGAAVAAPLVTMREDLTTRSVAGGASGAFNLPKIYPQHRSTRHLVRLTLHVSRIYNGFVSVSDVTLFPTVNGVNQTARGGLFGVTGALIDAPFTMEFEVAHEGAAYVIGWRATVLGGSPAFTVTKAYAYITDVR